jgi:hypothetical protein
MADRIADREHMEQMMARIVDNLREITEEIKSGQAEMKSTVNVFQENMAASIANREDERKENNEI